MTAPVRMNGPVGYLASHYPAVSHTFVMREVTALRRLGVEIETMSIHRAGPEELLTHADREAESTTFSVLPTSARRMLRIHARALARRPSRYVGTLLRAIRLSPPGVRGHLWQLFYFVETMAIVERCLARGVRHLHAQFADGATDVALLVTHYLGPDASWSLAVHGPVEFRDLARNRLQAKVRDARFVQAISYFGRSQILSLLDEADWGKVHVVRCGVDPTVYSPDGPDSPEPPGGRFRILCVGRLVPWKGQSLLVEATARLVELGIDAHLTLIGDGPKRAELETLADRCRIPDRVTLLGAVGQDEIRAHYERADAVCLPSFAEGVPVVLMEAMALQRPVVSTRIMGIPELVEDGVEGLLVPPGDLGSLVRALERLAEDRELGERIGRAGRAKVLAEFDVRDSAKQLRALFDELPSAAGS